MGSGITRCTPPVGRRSDDAGCGDHGTVTGQRFWRTRRPIYCSAVQGAIPHATRPKRTDLIQRDALAARQPGPVTRPGCAPGVAAAVAAIRATDTATLPRTAADHAEPRFTTSRFAHLVKDVLFGRERS